MDPSLPSKPAAGGARRLEKRTAPEARPQSPATGQTRPALVSLNWEEEDIENRLGIFKGGRFTRVNKTFSLILAVIASALFLWLMFVLNAGHSGFQRLGTVFVRPGNLYATVPATLCFFWGVMVSLLKIPKINLQRKALDLAAVPQNRDFVLNEATARTVLERMRGLVDDTRNFILLNRIDRALSNLHNIGGVSDVSAILKAQAENDENVVASSYAMIHAMIWSIPVLGFIGTVLGLSMAIGRFTSVLSVSQGAISAAEEMSRMKDHLREVTGGLSTAFETTLVGLGFALILHLLADLVQQRETDFLDECNDYCQAHVVSKLRTRPKEDNAQ
ncbi:MAG TPA: MotA/TolQ/ExbB proton channel family protein [Verrucomicrobiae bacterium]|jgi:biopolymer transport protein ExbB/TolQ|nr:MotA/TolQ/ExbB proton channel family protein [Verrucomicrobiae bacterium]